MIRRRATGDDQTPGDGDDQTPGDGDDQTPGNGDDQTPGDGDDQTPGDGDQPQGPEQPNVPGKQGGAALSEKQPLIGPLDLSLQSVTIENIHYGDAPDGYTATYEVTLADYEGDCYYSIEGDDGGPYLYSEPFSLTLSEDAKTITLSNDAPVQATVQQTLVSSGSVLLSAVEQSLGMEDEGTLTFVYSPQQIFYVDVNWNDNRWSERPEDATLTVLQSADGVSYTEADIVELVSSSVADPNSYNTWTYTYAVPMHDAEGNPLVYTVTQASSAGYHTGDAVKSTDTQGDTRYTIVNTKLTDLTFDVEWKDNNNAYSTRPNQDTYIEGLVLYRDGEPLDRETDAAAYAALEVTGADGDPKWTVSFKNLPEYDPSGMPYTYMAVQGTVTANNTTLGGVIQYTPTYENKGNYAADIDGVYVDGGIINRLEGDTSFVGQKIWLDDGKTTRPNATLQIYRYPTLPDKNFETGSPVPIAILELDKTKAPGDPIEISFTTYGPGGKPLERFDEDGVEYVYFAKETLSGAGGYERVFDNSAFFGVPDPDAEPDPALDPEKTGSEKYMFNGGIIKNRRTGTLSITATKKWLSLANQTLEKSVVLALQKKNRETDKWESLEPERTAELNGFIAEVSEKSGGFSCPQFDEMGLPIEYRVVEKSATIDGATIDIPVGSTRFDVEASNLDWYTVTTLPEEANASEYTITNKLEGLVDLEIVKKWYPGPPAEETTLQFKVMQNDTKQYGELVEMTVDPEDSDTWVVRIPNLPKYDEKGAPYDYSAVEHAVDGYIAYYAYSFDDREKDQKKLFTTTVTNRKDGDNGPGIHVEKKWLDDGDETSRRPVTVGLFKASDKPEVADQKIDETTLRAADKWKGWISIDEEDYPEGTSDFDADFYAHYYVKELSASVGDAVTYYTATPEQIQNGNFGTEVPNGDPVADKLTGVLKTDTSLYQYIVTTEKKSGSDNSYLITNRRFGTVSIPVTKTWVDGNNIKSTRMAISYTLKRDGVSAFPVITKTTADSTWNHTFENLPKYDTNGKLYIYTVEEGADNWGDYSHGFQRQYKVGEEYHTNDVVTYTFTNRLSGPVTQPKIHKIWLDDGTERRPDIYFRLYRSVPDREPPVLPTDMGFIEHSWQTTGTTGPNHWICTFDNQPKYDGDGYKYDYYVREIMLLPGNYVDHFHDKAPEDVDFDATADGIGKTYGGGAYGLAPINKTVVNRQEYRRDINGKKIWVNTVGQLEAPDYPEATIKLYYMPYDEDMQKPLTNLEDKQPVTHDRDGDPIQDATIKNGATSFVFNNLPKYDEKGRTIYYVLEEQSIDGYLVGKPGALNFTLTNTYEPDSVMLRIALDKTFSGELLENLTANQYPTVKLEFYRQMQKEDGTSIGVEVKHLSAPSTPLTVTLGLDEWENNEGTPGYLHAEAQVAVPYWAPNGQPYKWFVKEEPINGYTISATDIDEGYIPVNISGDGTPTPIDDVLTLDTSVTINNEYTGGDLGGGPITITGSKTWNDDSNKYDTRPADTDITLTLQRRIQGEGDDKWTPLAGVSKVWISTAGNTWTYKFEDSSLVKYAPNGIEYDYRVVETPVTGYTAEETEVLASKPDYEANFTNRLQTTSLKLVKNWKYAIDGTVVGDIPADASDSFGLRGSGINVTFKLQRSTTNNPGDIGWDDVEYDGADLTKTLSADKTSAVWTGLPSFNKDSGSPYYYRAVETHVGGHAVASSAYTVTYGENAVTGEETGPQICPAPLPIRRRRRGSICNLIGVTSIIRTACARVLWTCQTV